MPNSSASSLLYAKAFGGAKVGGFFQLTKPGTQKGRAGQLAANEFSVPGIKSH